MFWCFSKNKEDFSSVVCFFLHAPSGVALISGGRGSGEIEDSARPLSEGSASPQQEHLLPFLSIETVTSPPPADNAGYLPYTHTHTFISSSRFDSLSFLFIH